jgi:hypothetical protein
MPAAYTKRLSLIVRLVLSRVGGKDCPFSLRQGLLRYLEELGLVGLGNEGVARVVHGGDRVLRYVDQDPAIIEPS